jgi:8-oxo-dGTP pyrophosphatase MutT (NUDIX family)
MKKHTHIYTQPYIVVGALIVNDEGKVLLLKENHLPDKGKWNIPAGKLDYGENPLEAVGREVLEETGLRFKPKAILGLHSIHRKDVPNELGTTHVLRIVFTGSFEGKLTNQRGEVENGEPEISEYKWLDPKDILGMSNSLIRYHDLKDYIDEFLSDKSYPLELITHLVQ